jgi:transcriptional regulator GlxA family with amidase domain
MDLASPAGCGDRVAHVVQAVEETRIHPERVLIISGVREELVSSGASTTWHDMVLHLIARYAGSTTAQEVERFCAQRWLSDHFSVTSPVEEMIKRSKLTERTFKRRFAKATGLAPGAYRKRFRVPEFARQ